MALIGFSRFSTDGQSLAAPDAALRKAGCTRIFAERTTDSVLNRTRDSTLNLLVFSRSLSVLKPNDIRMATIAVLRANVYRDFSYAWSLDQRQSD
jgi:hypothetical protein